MSDNLKNETPEVLQIVERNVNALLHRKKEDRKKRGLTEKIVDAITSFAASMASVFIHSVAVRNLDILELGLSWIKTF
jgi:uncharacterized membrane protein